MRVDFLWPVSEVWVSCRVHEGGQSDTETKPDNSYHTLANALHFQCLLLGVTFDSTNSKNCFHYSPFQSVLTPRGCLGVVQNCVSGHLCVWRDVRVLGTGCNCCEGYAHRLLTFTRVPYKFPHSPFVLAMF